MDYQVAGYQDNRISGNGSQIRGEYQILNEKCRIAKGRRRKIVAQNDKCCVFLQPIAWVVDGFRADAELSAQFINKCFQPFYLAVG
jgi:hypothetical protein